MMKKEKKILLFYTENEREKERLKEFVCYSIFPWKLNGSVPHKKYLQFQTTRAPKHKTADLVPLFSVYVTHYPVTPKINSAFLAASYANALRSFWSSSACFKHCHLFLHYILCFRHEYGISPETKNAFFI